MQTLLFNLMNKRYNAKNPTIFSSNYSLNELINLRGVADRTVDRITEMTKGAVMRIEGKSWRNKNHNEDIPFLGGRKNGRIKKIE
jgi:DNA replication protein DnaC